MSAFITSEDESSSPEERPRPSPCASAGDNPVTLRHRPNREDPGSRSRLRLDEMPRPER